jgi:hypothetical protein
MSMAGIAIPMHPWDRGKHEFTIIICDAGVKPQFNLDLRFGIDAAVERWPADGLLRAIENEVTRIIAETEAQARIVGLI